MPTLSHFASPPRHRALAALAVFAAIALYACCQPLPAPRGAALGQWSQPGNDAVPTAQYDRPGV